MKKFGIKEIKEIINDMRLEGAKNGVSCIVLNANDINDKFNPHEYSIIPTVCMAMRQCMLEGDVVTVEPKGVSGLGSRLTIQYQTNDLDTRAPMYVKKEPGRPRMTDEQKRKRAEERNFNKAQRLLKMINVRISLETATVRTLDSMKRPYRISREKFIEKIIKEVCESPSILEELLKDNNGGY